MYKVSFRFDSNENYVFFRVFQTKDESLEFSKTVHLMELKFIGE